MSKKVKVEDTTVSISKGMSLEIKETRGSTTTHSPKYGYTEVSSNTETNFHWKLCGITSKLGADAINAEDFDPKDQELFDVEFLSDGFRYGFSGFKSREDAIRNALEFADRNEIDVDGYSGKKK